MNLFLQVQVDLIFLFCLTILIIYSYNKLNRLEKVDRLFFILSSLTFLILIFEIFSILLNASNISLLFLHKLVNILKFLLSPIIFYLWYTFILVWTDKDYRTPIKFRNFLIIPFIVNSIICVLNFKFNLIFSIDPVTNVYNKGPIFFAPLITNGSYLCCICAYFIKNKNKIIFLEIILFLKGFFISVTLLGGLQILFPKCSFIWSCFSMLLILTYILIQQELSEKDPLTGAFNRKFFYSYIDKLNRNKPFIENFAAINIALDDFKSINDTYGHTIGDEVLKALTKLLKKSFGKKGFIIRMGGDQFIVLINSTTKYGLDILLFNMNKNIYLYNKQSNQPYKIKFNYGYALYDYEFDTFDDFFNYIDTNMYKDKYFTHI